MTAEHKTAALRGEFLQGKEHYIRLSKDWDDLFSRTKDAPAYFSRPWLETIINQNHFRGHLSLIAVWHEATLVALLPLTVRSICGLRLAEPIGTSEPSCLGVLRDAAYDGAVSAVADVWIREHVAHVFYNKYLYVSDSGTKQLFDELSKRGYTVKQGFTRPCPGIQLGCPFDEYLRHTKSGKRRKKLRYAERQVMDAGNVEVKYYHGTELTDAVNNRIAAIQSESWMDQRGAAVLGQAFYQNLLKILGNAGLAHVWIMTIDGNDAAFSYALVAHGNLDLRWMAFKLKYESSVSFGKILTMQVIRDACKQGIRFFNLGLGDSEWKRFWATDNYDLTRIVAGRGGRGFIAALAYRIAWFLAEQQWLLSLYQRIRR